MHGGFSLADTYNFMAALGPDFREHFSDEAPASNADIGQTIAALLNLKIPNRGILPGRVLGEAMHGGTMPRLLSGTMTSKPAANGLATVLECQMADRTVYFDAGGFPGRSVGVDNKQPTKE